MSFKSIQKKVSSIISDNKLTVNNKLSEICNLLQTSIDYYDWIGFYFANHKEKTLHLKAFAGEETNHETIPFGKGICGQVAVSNQNFVVPDVKVQNNYIACSTAVKAEIVIPLFKDGKNIGQIDVDSHTANAFTQNDEYFLVWVNKQVALIL